MEILVNVILGIVVRWVIPYFLRYPGAFLISLVVGKRNDETFQEFAERHSMKSIFLTVVLLALLIFVISLFQN